MAISIVGTVTGSSGAGTSANPAVTLPAGLANGDLGILLVSTANTGAVTDPAGWSLLSPSPLLSGAILAGRVYTKSLTSAESSTAVTVTLAATKWSAICIIFRGANTTLDGSSSTTQTTNTTSLTVPAVTPVAANCMLVQASAIRLSTATAVSHTPAAGWTEQAELLGGATPCNDAALSTLQLVGQAGVAQGPYTATMADPSQMGTFTIAVSPSGVVTSPGTFGDTLTYSMNRVAGTLVGGRPTLAATGAANVWAGTTGLALIGALNVKAGNTLPNYKGLQGVLNQLAGTTGLGVAAAAASILA